MIIPRRSLAVRHAVAKDKTRYILDSVRAIPGQTEATDGHVLATVRFEPMDREAFPEVENSEDWSGEPVYFDGNAVYKAIPKLKRLPPGVHNALVVANGDGPEVVTTDLETQQSIRATTEGTWPNVDAVLPKDPPSAIVTLSPAVLAQVARIAKEFGADSLQIEVRETDKPLVAYAESEAGDLRLVFMPMTPVAEEDALSQRWAVPE